MNALVWLQRQMLEIVARVLDQTGQEMLETPRHRGTVRRAAFHKAHAGCAREKLQTTSVISASCDLLPLRRIFSLNMPALSTLLRHGIAAFALTVLSSCGTVTFYAQAVHGQMEILHGAKPLREVEADPATPEKLRRRLELIGQMREFARTHLDLTVQKQFGTYKDLHRPYVVWNVYSAPEFSTEADSWWYPFVGEAKYRGYFSVAPAKKKALELRAGGKDVFVGGIRVYSTLGWFRDPVLNTFVDDEEGDLAETLFHELAHARVFLSGDTDFNEAFATAVGEEGARRWFRSQGRTKDLQAYEQSLVEEKFVLHLLESARSRLDDLYDQKDRMPVEEMRRKKAAILGQLRADFLEMKKRGLTGKKHDHWFDGRLNNARLATVATYHALVPTFNRILQREGGDFSKLYADVEAMRPLSVEERRQKLKELAGER